MTPTRRGLADSFASSAAALAGDLCGGEGNNVGRALAAFFMPQEARNPGAATTRCGSCARLFDRNDPGHPALRGFLSMVVS